MGIRVAAPAKEVDVVARLTQAIDEQARELAALRALPARIEAERVRAEEEAARAARLERERDAVAARADELTAWRARLAEAGWLERRRLLREFATARFIARLRFFTPLRVPGRSFMPRKEGAWRHFARAVAPAPAHDEHGSSVG